MGNIISIVPKPKSPGINLNKWHSSFAIAAVLLVRLKQIRLLKRLLRIQDKRLAEAEKIIKIQHEAIEFLKQQIERIKFIV